MKKVTWGIDQDVYDFVKKQAEETGLSVQQTANLILKRYRIDIKIAPVGEKRKRGNPDFLKKEGKRFEEELKGCFTDEQGL